MQDLSTSTNNGKSLGFGLGSSLSAAACGADRKIPDQETSGARWPWHP